MPRRALLLPALALLLAGCAGEAQEPPRAPAPLSIPPVRPISKDASRLAAARLPRLIERSSARRAEELTVRVRNIACRLQDSATGSGFAVSSHILVTNRHVLQGGQAISVDTWDGRRYRASDAVVGTVSDLGVVRVSARLPEVARVGPRPRVGAPVEAVGYPLGGPLTISPGRVLGSYYDASLPGRVILTSAKANHGNSGGPLLDSKGRVVGVVYKGVPGRYTLAIPIQSLLALIGRAELRRLPGC